MVCSHHFVLFNTATVHLLLLLCFYLTVHQVKTFTDCLLTHTSEITVYTVFLLWLNLLMNLSTVNKQWQC